MECLTAKSKIQNTVNEVTELSTQKNIKALTEDHTNKLLDAISEVRSIIENRTEIITQINSKLSELSWLQKSDMDEECLTLINDLLIKSEFFHKKLIRIYANMSWVTIKGYAPVAMRNHKIALDDLKEHNQDLTDLFFNLPTDIEFANRIQMLSK